MRLSELLGRVPFVRAVNFCDRDIVGITHDSRRVKNGFIFAALEGENHRADAFISDAKERGACAILTECENAKETSENTIICKNARKTMAEMAKEIYCEHVAEMTVIAFTGTKGKTTTSLCLFEILRGAGIPTVAIGTTGVTSHPACPSFPDTDNTTPESPEIYKILGEAYSLGIRVALIEVSSQALMKNRIYGLPVYAAVFTNISEDHVGSFEHSSYENYYLAKKSLFTSYGAKLAFLNMRDRMSRYVANGVKKRVFVTQKIIPSKDAYRSHFRAYGMKLSIRGGGYNAENASLAIAVAKRVFHVTDTVIGQAVFDFCPTGRFETYRLYGKTVLIDYAHNEESVRALLTGLRGGTDGRLIAVFGSVGMRSKGRRSTLARVCETYADVSIITADNPDREPAETVCSEIFSHFKDRHRARVITDRTEAIAAAVSMAHRGDMVVLLGKGHERFQLIDGKRWLFSERAVVLALGGIPI